MKEVSLFVPCFVDQLWPAAAIATVRILETLGYRVHYPPRQSCCGQPAYNAGHTEEARAVMRHTEDVFAHTPRPIVMPSASCTGFVREYYPKEIGKAPEIYELVAFLDRFENGDIRRLRARFPHSVTYHDSCSALRELHLGAAVRKLLAQVEGLQLVEMKDTDRCCGFGGTFSVKFPAVSTAMARFKLDRALDTGAEYVVSTDVSCLMHLQAYARAHRIPIRMLHLAEVLAAPPGQ